MADLLADLTEARSGDLLLQFSAAPHNTSLTLKPAFSFDSTAWSSPVATRLSIGIEHDAFVFNPTASPVNAPAHAPVAVTRGAAFDLVDASPLVPVTTVSELPQEIAVSAAAADNAFALSDAIDLTLQADEPAYLIPEGAISDVDRPNALPDQFHALDKQIGPSTMLAQSIAPAAAIWPSLLGHSLEAIWI